MSNRRDESAGLTGAGAGCSLQGGLTNGAGGGRVTPSVPFLTSLGQGGAPPGGNFHTVGRGKRTRLGRARRGPRACLQVAAPSHVSRPLPQPQPRGRRHVRQEADFSPCTRAPGRLLCSCPSTKGPGGHRPLWPLPPLRVPASQEAFPEGHCISRVTVLGVPPPASPSSAPSLRARWKTTLRGSHSRCDLSLPARK